jgi:hypothetical protein
MDLEGKVMVDKDLEDKDIALVLDRWEVTKEWG